MTIYSKGRSVKISSWFKNSCEMKNNIEAGNTKVAGQSPSGPAGTLWQGGVERN